MAFLGVVIIVICCIIGIIGGIAIAVNTEAYNFQYYAAVTAAIVSFLGLIMLGFSLMFNWITLID